MTCRNSEGTPALQDGQEGFVEFKIKQSVAGGGGDDDGNSRRKDQPRRIIAEQQQRLQ